jgi:hypothetical protein
LVRANANSKSASVAARTSPRGNRSSDRWRGLLARRHRRDLEGPGQAHARHGVLLVARLERHLDVRLAPGRDLDAGPADEPVGAERHVDSPGARSSCRGRAAHDAATSTSTLSGRSELDGPDFVSNYHAAPNATRAPAAIGTTSRTARAGDCPSTGGPPRLSRPANASRSSRIAAALAYRSVFSFSSAHDLLDRGGTARRGLPERFRALGDHLARERRDVGRVEDRPAGDGLVQRRAERVDVGARVHLVAAAEHLLGVGAACRGRRRSA